jgi:hypothetical protein
MLRLYILPMRMLILYMILASAVYSWGLRGHRIVARIAENHLSETARKKVKELLGEDPLTKVANEADSYRSDSKWKCAAPLHYVSVEDGDTYLKSEKSAQGDIVRALVYFEDALRDTKTNSAARVNALKWLVHLVGDIHQPLHVGRACDRGGNSVEVSWFKTKSNLHRVWDSQFINQEELSFSEYADQLDKIDDKAITRLEASTYLDWAAESQALRSQLYTCLAKDGCCANKGKCKTDASSFGACSADAPDFRVNLEYAYVEKNRELLNRQLLRAGVRLAALLNRVFGDQGLSSAEVALRKEFEALRTEDRNPVQQCIERALK